MKFKPLAICLLSLVFFRAYPQGIPTGIVKEGLSMTSTILGRNVNYVIYLPADYETSNRNYPVVYLLHGYSDNENAWVQFGEVNLTADRAIANREIPPMIIVMPDAQTTWYMNDEKGLVKYEDMFFQEFIPYIDKTYHTRAKKEFRGISGLSMGGFGSLAYSLKHPDMFAACAAFSPAIWTDEEVKAFTGQTFAGTLQTLYGLNKDKNMLTPIYRKSSVLDLVAQLPKDQIEQVRFYIDCGDDDFLYKGNCTLHMIMRDRQIKHEFRTRNGGHSWVYWRTGILDGLKFIGESFQR